MATKTNSFPCPKCKGSTTVINSRAMGEVDGATTIKRRRKCLGCDYRITTFESAFGSLAMKRKIERAKNKLRRVREMINELTEEQQ